MMADETTEQTEHTEEIPNETEHTEEIQNETDHTEERIQTDTEHTLNCKYCNKDLSHIRTQPENIRRHEEKCERVELRKKEAAAKKKKNNKRNAGIKNYFRTAKAAKVDSVVVDDSVELPEVNFTGVHDEGEVDLTEANHVNFTSIAAQDISDAPSGDLLPEISLSEVPMPVPDNDVSDDDISPSTISVSVQEDASFCPGFKPQLLGSVFDCFPFHLLRNSTDVIFSNDSFHSKACQDNNFFLFEKGSSVNVCCKDIAGDPRWVKLVADANDPERYLSTAKDENMSMQQLRQRLNNQRTRLNNMKLKSLNLKRTLERVNKSLELHQRFVSLIKENNIPKLHELVKVASNRSRGIEYVIRRMVDAIGGAYNARSSEDDVDLAFLILQYGGPGLLDIVHRALKFPSTSTAYRLLQKSKEMIKSSVNTNIHDFIHNLHPDPNAPSHGFMLKIDETYGEAKVRWNPRDNGLYGFCYEHGRDKDLEFTSYEHVEELAQMVKDETLCTPKETMVIACSNNSPHGKLQVAAALPTCSKKETEYQANLIEALSSDFKDKHGAPLLNWSTDGDAVRRRIFDFLMSHTLKEDSDIFHIVSQLKLVDLDVGRNEETTNFDSKHIAKRLRTFLIGGNFKVGNHIFTKRDVKKILDLVPNNTKYKTESLLNPKDKQNVPLAVQLLLLFSEAVDDVEKLKTVSFRVESVAEDLHLMKYVIDGVLCTFVDSSVSIKEQLISISTAAHVLMIMQRELITFVPNQLYHDLQATFEDAFFCAAKWKIYHPYLPLFLMLCSNDVLERFFGNLRLKYKLCMIDNLEIIFATRAMELCGDMMSKHPEWFEKNRNVMQRISLDYSNPRDWDQEKLILQNVDIVSAFMVGRAKAVTVLNKFDKYGGTVSDFGSLAEIGYTFLIPYGTKKIGFNPDEIDLSMADIDQENENSDEAVGETSDATDNEDDDEIEDIPATSIIDMVPQDEPTAHKKFDPQILVENSYVYKATIVKSLFSSSPMSKDRLRRVRGMTKYTDEGGDNSQAIESSLMVGDPLLITVKEKLQLSKIEAIRVANRKVKSLEVNELNKANVMIDARRLKVSEKDDFYIWLGEFIGDSFRSSGTNCYAIQPELKEIEGKYRFAFDKQFIIDYDVALTLQNQAAQSVQGTNAPRANAVQSGSKKKSKEGNLVKCHKCKKQVDLLQMRTHIGVHILRGSLDSSCCGFCGSDCCQNMLVDGTKGKGKQYYKVTTNCEYKVQWNKTPHYSTRNHCSNHLAHCTVCKASVWTYNMKKHYEDRHPEFQDVPELVSNVEIEQMKKKKV